MHKYLFIALWFLFFAPSANAQKEQPLEVTSLAAMPSYEERDTLVKYEDGLYQERYYIVRTRIDAEYIAEQDRQAEDRRKLEDQQAEKRAEMRTKLDEKIRERTAAPPPKKKKKG